MSTTSRTSSDKENACVRGLISNKRCKSYQVERKRVIQLESKVEVEDGSEQSEGNNSEEEGEEEESVREEKNARKKVKGSVEEDSSDSDWDLEPVVVKRRKVKRDESGSNNGDSDYSKDTLPVSPAPSSIRSHETGSPKSKKDGSESDDSDGSESSGTPEGQWEIEEILDFVRDDLRELYYVKWKDWAADFNTWEPIDNLLNCEEELLRFYKKRKEERKDALERSEYVELPNGKKRRKGPRLPDVPPDPRPFDVRVQEFFDVSGGISNKDILKVFLQWKTMKPNSKSRWPRSKVDQYLEDGIQGKLSKIQIKELKDELVVIEVEKRKKTLSEEMNEWEQKINHITGGKPTITIENDVDMTGSPIGFEFVNDYVPGDGVVIPKDPPVGCTCEKGSTNCYDERKQCCAMQFGYKFAYTRFKKVNVMQGSPIYECNSKCMCGSDCPNRVVQDGKSDHKLSIFRTNNGRGWGVKTLKSIKKGSFVTLYVGEVIKSEEAERRGKLYDAQGCTYLFDLDFNDPDSYPYSVDASKYGNVAHFINHSCSPNLGVYAVWTDCLDPNLPKLAMFALKDIAKNEELTFDYDIQLSGTKTKHDEEEDTKQVSSKNRTICLCGTAKCRKFIF